MGSRLFVRFWISRTISTENSSTSPGSFMGLLGGSSAVKRVSSCAETKGNIVKYK
ncbi:hypothetical protein [Desulfospira joergensenii]|uniref:hypothetical protein n=1 Tax=Desulfospira joergensenii TaxID=53329 RepID=UPI00129472E3|nr:hypothetical protein [Desulfospira joergensenii]